MTRDPVRITVFGASGRTGREVVARAAAAGMDVTAYVRDPARLGRTPDGVRVLTGTLDDDGRLAEAVAGRDAAVSALGVGRPLRTDPAVVEGVRRIVAAMEAAGVPRLVYLSFVGVADSRARSGPVIRHVLSRVVRNEAADHERKEAIVRSSGLEWTIVRPPLLTSGPADGALRAGEDVAAAGALPRASRAAVADYLVAQVTATDQVRRAPSLLP
jgi:putative NADH-flavin reductase